MTEHGTKEIKEEIRYQTVAEFLESTPPNQLSHISDLCEWSTSAYNQRYSQMNMPEIQLHCDHDDCNGIRFFRCTSGGRTLKVGKFEFFYVTYGCSNCQDVQKTFSLGAKATKRDDPSGECFKFGELPLYGPPVSPKLIKLVGPDRDEFLKGRRCENQGLGVGAFIYYRRVVENQKNRILEEIIKVSNKIGAAPEKLEVLRGAVKETQFARALEKAKDALPESLLIDGHNPLLLLHNALSEGVHKLTDEQCLEIAGSVRVVLGELSERLSQALKDEAELTKALSTLMKRRND